MIQFLFASGEIVPIKFVIWAICIGTNLGFLYTYLSKNVVGGVVRKLLSSANSEEEAKTLSELGYSKFSLLHKFLLKDGGILRSIISVAGGQIPKISNSKGEEVTDFDNARFYIPAGNKDKAMRSYGTPQKWIFLPIFAIASVAISYVMTLIMPILFEALI